MITSELFCDQQWSDESGKFVCTVCGWKYHKKAHRNCPVIMERKFGPGGIPIKAGSLRRFLEPVGLHRYPPLTAQVSIFVTTMWQWAKDRCRLATSAESRRRRAICRTCPRYQPGWIARCKQCGCSIRAKSLLKIDTCPKKKW